MVLAMTINSCHQWLSMIFVWSFLQTYNHLWCMWVHTHMYSMYVYTYILYSANVGKIKLWQNHYICVFGRENFGKMSNLFQCNSTYIISMYVLINYYVYVCILCPAHLKFAKFLGIIF